MYSSEGLENWEMLVLSTLLAAGALTVSAVIGLAAAAVALHQPSAHRSTLKVRLRSPEGESVLPEETTSVEPAPTGRSTDRGYEMGPA